jgi:hypothetical protein
MAARPMDAAPLQSDAERLCAHFPAGGSDAATHSTILPTDPDGDDDCPELCEKWVALCRNVVKLRKKCWVAAAAQTAKLRKAECNTLADQAARTQCLDVLKGEKDDLKIFLAITSETGFTTCEQDGWGACTAHCD